MSIALYVVSMHSPKAYTNVCISFSAAMKHTHLSFSACGFLGIYHLGAATMLCMRGRSLLRDIKGFAGASAGALVAAVLLTAPERLEVRGQV